MCVIAAHYIHLSLRIIQIRITCQCTYSWITTERSREIISIIQRYIEGCVYKEMFKKKSKNEMCHVFEFTSIIIN